MTSLTRWATDAAASLPSTVILVRRCSGKVVFIRFSIFLVMNWRRGRDCPHRRLPAHAGELPPDFSRHKKSFHVRRRHKTNLDADSHSPGDICSIRDLVMYFRQTLKAFARKMGRD